MAHLLRRSPLQVWMAVELLGDFACWTNLFDDDIAVVLLHYLRPSLRRGLMAGNVQKQPRVFPDLTIFP